MPSSLFVYHEPPHFNTAGDKNVKPPPKFIPRCQRIGTALLVAGMLLMISFRPALAQHQIDPETWIQMRKMFRDKIPATTIEEDIAALEGEKARTAGPKLIDRGPIVLPAVHEALRKTDNPPRRTIGLLQVIQALGDKSSVPVLLDLLREYPKAPFRRDLLLTLAKLPATEEAYTFIASLAADNNEPWNTRRMAFTWFGMHRDRRGRKLADAFRGDPDLQRRIPALYVLAMLGDPGALEPVAQILKDGAPASYRNILLISLAQLTAPDDFQNRAPASLSWSDGYKNALLYARYTNAGDSAKPAICRELLRSSYPGHLRTAVRCLLDTGHADDLRPLAALSLEVPGQSALIRNEIRKAGWQIIDTETEFRIVPPGS